MISVAQQTDYTVLDHALADLGQQVQERQWKREQDPMLQAMQLAAALRAMLALYGLHRQLVDVWADGVRDGTMPFRPEDARVIQMVRRRTMETMRGLSQDISEIETAGIQVQGADEFRSALVDCQLDDVDVDKALAAIDRLERGQGVPLAEAMHELRARH